MLLLYCTEVTTDDQTRPGELDAGDGAGHVEGDGDSAVRDGPDDHTLTGLSLAVRTVRSAPRDVSLRTVQG